MTTAVDHFGLVAGVVPNKPDGIPDDTPVIEYGGTYAAFAVITDVMARCWLERNNNYRARSDTKEKELTGAIGRGEFELNCETIKFNDRNELIDGQTRLNSLANAGGEIVALVCWGVRSDKNIDMGRKRTFGDQLLHKGEKNANTLAGATRWMWKYSKRPGNANVWLGGGVPATVSELENTLAAYPSLRNGVTWGMRMRPLNQPALTAAFYSAICTKNPEHTVGRFFDKLNTGAELLENDPIYRLRERLQDNRNPASKTRLATQEVAALFFLAWNHWKAGRTVSKGMLRWRAVGPAAQPFPDID